MQLKRITAPDARTATRLATARYGSEALIVSNERINGRVEVLVAVEDDVPARTDRAPGSPAKQPAVEDVQFGAILAAVSAPHAAGPQASVDSESARAKELVSWLRDEFTELRREFQLQQKLALWQPPSSLTPIGRHWDDALAAASAPGALRALLTSHVSEAPDLEQSVEMARAILSARFPAQKPPHSLDGVHVLAGPSGSGKTLMVARLARVHAAARGYGPDQIAVISLGDLRPGAWSQIQLLGAQAGVECFRAADASVAAGLLEELGSRRLVLVDTPGTGGKDMVSALQRSLPRLTAHLVVPADISVAALKRLTCDPEWKWSSLMVTKLDEATCAWGLIQAGPEAGLEISFAAAEPRAGLPLSGGVAERLAGAAIGNLVVTDHADSD